MCSRMPPTSSSSPSKIASTSTSTASARNLSTRIGRSGATHVTPDRPILVDKFLADAVEVDVDAIFDGDELLVGGILEHIEEAGVHSGDSACVMPPHTLPSDTVATLVDYTERIAKSLD